MVGISRESLLVSWLILEESTQEADLAPREARTLVAAAFLSRTAFSSFVPPRRSLRKRLVGAQAQHGPRIGELAAVGDDRGQSLVRRRPPGSPLPLHADHARERRRPPEDQPL